MNCLLVQRGRSNAASRCCKTAQCSDPASILITAYVPGLGGVPAVAVVDCQPPLPVVSLSDTTLTVGEGNSVQVTAILDSMPNGTAAVWFSTSGGIGGTGSCFNGAEFSVDQSSFVFTNTTTASITFTACDDSDTDDETIALSLTTTGISGLELGSPTTVTVTITDDDSAYDGSNDGWGL